MANNLEFKRVTAWPSTWDIATLYFKYDSAAPDAGLAFAVTGNTAAPVYLDAVSASYLVTQLNLHAKLAGNNTFTGTNTFNNPVTVATPTANGHATTKLYVDTADAALQTQINALQSSLQPPVDIDCSANPNYPSGTPGKNWIVTVAGKIGGASGADVEVGDWIICKTTSAGGTHASVGSNYFIVQRNIGEATESVIGMIRKHTNAEAAAMVSTAGAINAYQVGLALDAATIRFDKAQSLTAPQKAQALANIGGIDQTAGDARYLRLSGGTLTGGLLGTTAGFTGNIGAGTTTPTARVHASGGNMRISGSSYPGLELLSSLASADEYLLHVDATSVHFRNVTDAKTIMSINMDAPAAAMSLTSAGNVLIGNTNGTEKLTVTGNIRASGQLISAVAVGTAPLVVTSTTLVPNLNVERLNGQLGAYYLDYHNFTNKPTSLPMQWAQEQW